MAIKNRLSKAAEILKEAAFEQCNRDRIISEHDVIIFNSSFWDINTSGDDSLLYIATDSFIDNSLNERGDFEANISVDEDINDCHERYSQGVESVTFLTKVKYCQIIFLPKPGKCKLILI